MLVNGAGERFWGMSREEMIGKTADEVFPAEEAGRIEARDNELLRSSQPIFDEREIVTAAGESRMIFSRRITFRDQRDQALYILGVVDDGRREGSPRRELHGSRTTIRSLMCPTARCFASN